MISIRWMELAHPGFQDAVRVIWDCPMLDSGTSYKASRIMQGVEKVNRDIRELRVKLVEKYAKKGEDGKTLTDPRGMVQFESEEKQREFEAEFQKEFESRLLELKVSKIDFQTLGSVRGITPRQWEFLAPILENLPADPEDAPADEELDQGNVIRVPTKKT
jgi:hypothetical protein